MTTVPIICSVNYTCVVLTHNPESTSNINMLINRYWDFYLHSSDGNIKKSGCSLTKDGVDQKQSDLAFPWLAVSTANMNVYVPSAAIWTFSQRPLPLPLLTASCWLSVAFFLLLIRKCFIWFGLFLLAMHVSKCYLWMYVFCHSSSFLFVYI